MWIWEIECIVKWTYNETDDECDLDQFTLAAPDYKSALAKLEKIALAKSRGFKDDNDPDSPTFGKMLYPEKIVDVTKMERKNWIDG